MTELYTMMRYLQHDTIQRKGLAHFDCWASTFGETQTAIELAPEVQATVPGRASPSSLIFRS
jgi:N12 class adenine-specific DNA methylase